MIRHGEGVHDVGNKEKDAKLTDSGKIQARNAGMMLQNIYIDTVFVSELFRTRETLDELLKHMTSDNLPDGNSPLEYLNQNIFYVLPCANEVYYPYCSGIMNWVVSLFSPENKPNCNKKSTNSDCKNHGNHELKWRDCKGKNMIEAILNFVKENPIHKNKTLPLIT